MNRLRVLMVSSDPGLVGKDGQGDVFERHKRYASNVSLLEVLVLRSNGASSRYDALSINPMGRNPFTMLFKAVWTGLWISRKESISVIVSQDPHLCGLVSWTISCITGKPLGVSLHGDFMNPIWKREKLRNRWYSMIQRFVIAKARRIRVVSDGIRDSLVASGVPVGKIQVINTPVNDKVFGNSADVSGSYQRIRGQLMGRPLFLFVGRFVASKNLIFVIDVFTEIARDEPTVLLGLLGHGPDEKALREHVRIRGIERNVMFIPPQTHEQLAAYYKAARALILLSTNESFGKVIVEAGFCGVPAIASDTVGARQIIEHRVTGLIVPINDAEKTRQAITSFIRDEGSSKRMGEDARRRYREHFSSDAAVSAVIDYWQRLIV